RERRDAVHRAVDDRAGRGDGGGGARPRGRRPGEAHRARHLQPASARRARARGANARRALRAPLMFFHFDFANYFAMVRLAWNEKNPRARRTYLAKLLLWIPPVSA